MWSKTWKFGRNLSAEDSDIPEQSVSESHQSSISRSFEKQVIETAVRNSSGITALASNKEKSRWYLEVFSTPVFNSSCWLLSVLQDVCVVCYHFQCKKNVCTGGKHIPPSYLTAKRFIFLCLLVFTCAIATIKSLVFTVTYLCYKRNVNIWSPNSIMNFLRWMYRLIDPQWNLWFWSL